MSYWRILVGIVLVVMVLGILFLWTRFHKFRCMQRLGARHRFLSWLLCLVPLACIGLFSLINVITMIVVALHLALFWILCDLLGWCVNRLRKKRIYPTRGKRKKVRLTPYYAGIMALVLCAVYLGIGWYNAHHVRETRYMVTTEKDLGVPLTIAVISDAHLGITLDGSAFGALLERIQAQQPDLLLIVGDYVDDDSPRADMLKASDALGRFEAPYGVCYVFGNHDEGYSRYRDFDSRELRSALISNGVKILEDETVLIDDRFYVIGRKDRSDRNRETAADLTQDLDLDRFMVVLDHQPNDYEQEAASGVDLVVSGHTHGGHMLPAGWIGEWLGANDRTYGTEQRDGTTFVVTSGVSGWAIPFKTGTFSEYVIIEVNES